MQGIKVEGIILKRKDLGEADRILTVLTHKRGKISILAKGVRRITSRRSGNVELLNRSLMYLHQGKSFLILTEATSLDTYPKLKMDLTLSTYAFHIIELVDKFTAENILSPKDYFPGGNQENQILYEHLVNVLQRLSRNPRQILVRAFEVKILSLMGFADFQEEKGVHLEDVSLNTKDLLKKLDLLSWDEIEKIKLEQKQALELEALLRYHIERVIEGRLKSRQILKKL